MTGYVQRVELSGQMILMQWWWKKKHFIRELLGNGASQGTRKGVGIRGGFLVSFTCIYVYHRRCHQVCSGVRCKTE